MKDEDIKQLLQESLLPPEELDFNEQILRKIEPPKRKSSPVLFSEKSILHWFLLISLLALGYGLIYPGKPNSSMLWVGTVVCALPLFLMVFNKIFALRFKK